MLSLKPGQLDVWLADQNALFDPARKSQWLAWLADDELARYNRFLYNKHKQRFLLTRAVSRSILSHYARNVDAADWRFLTNAYGKPEIEAPKLSMPIHFNISHSADKLVMVVSRHGSLGIDVESTVKNRATLKIGRRYFSEVEYQALCELSPASIEERFYNLWTLKEAYIKACGMGLAISLQQFSFTFTEPGKIAISFAKARHDEPALWQFWQFVLSKNYKLALALKSATRISDKDIVARQLTSLSQYSDIELPLASSS